MKRKETVAVLLMVVILLTTPALAGGFIVLGFQNNISFSDSTNDEYLNSHFNNLHLASGTAPGVEFSAGLDSNFITKKTNYGATIKDNDAYFAHTQGKYNLKAGELGENPSSKSVNVNSYIAMTHKFDSIQTIVMNFINGDPNKAKVETELTYKGKTYQFGSVETKKADESSFNLFLQPFCKEFENTGLEDATSSTYEETASSSGLGYSGGLTIRAAKS
jgi:hypothetical protein